MSKLEQGIYMEFENNEFILNLVDEKFVEEELRALQKNPASLFYVSMGVVDLFLFQIEDSLDTSDIPFCVFDYKEDAKFISSLDSDENYNVQVRYIDEDGNLVATRTGTMSATYCATLRQQFKHNVMSEFDEASYEASLAKIQNKYEPFELEEKAIGICKL